MDGQRKARKKRNCGRADGERGKNMIDKHLKLLTMPRAILFYKNYKKKKIIKKLLKKLIA